MLTKQVDNYTIILKMYFIKKYLAKGYKKLYAEAFEPKPQ